MEVGENLIDALKREIKEESGIDVEVLNLLNVSCNTSIYKWHDNVTDVPTKVILDFLCNPISGELTTSEETSEVRWVEKSKVLDLITAPAIRSRYQKYLDFNGRVHYMEYATKSQFDLKLNQRI